MHTITIPSLVPTSSDGYPDIGSKADDALSFGRFLNVRERRIEGRLRYGGDQSALLVGPSGKGKFARMLAPNLLQNKKISMVILDPKGEQGAVCAPYRSTLGPVYVINPCGAVLKDFAGYEYMRSCGFNPMRPLNPYLPDFNEKAVRLAEAFVTEDATDKHFIPAARNLIACVMMWEAVCAVREHRAPDIRRIRQILSMPSAPAFGDRPAIGLPSLAREWMHVGLPALANKAGQFVEWTREKISIASVALTQSEFLDDPAITADMTTTPEKNGHVFDFGQLKRDDGQVITVFLVLPLNKLERHAKWLRMMLTSGLDSVMRPRREGEPRVRFLLDEFPALKKMDVIADNWALMRGFGVQMLAVFQNITQMEQVYGDKVAKTFIAQSGVIASFGTNDAATAKWLSDRAGEKTGVMAGYNHSQQSGGNNHQSSGLNWSQVKLPRLTPGALYGLPEGAMVQFVDGQESMIPSYAPAYWEIAECRERAKPNPYAPHRH
jgi:type IV secretion system protein VirD4